ncbi:MAG: hypothetical protein K1X81_05400 [Bacteroidia bacterium]|nr:hypothetical protein [Bacteroidia bacterium]
MKFYTTICFSILLLACENHDEKLMLQILKANNLSCEASISKAQNDLKLVRKYFFHGNIERGNKIIEEYERIVNPIYHFRNALKTIPKDSILIAFSVAADSVGLYLDIISYDCATFNQFTIKYYKQLAQEGLKKYSNDEIQRNFALNCLYHIPDCYVKTINVGKYMPSHGYW